jgi:hypothetical protein
MQWLRLEANEMSEISSKRRKPSKKPDNNIERRKKADSANEKPSIMKISMAMTKMWQ